MGSAQATSRQAAAARRADPGPHDALRPPAAPWQERFALIISSDVQTAAVRLQFEAAAYSDACKNCEKPDHVGPLYLAELQHARTRATIALAQIASATPADVRAKAEQLLHSIERLDPSPELELARSLAADVFLAGAL